MKIKNLFKNNHPRTLHSGKKSPSYGGIEEGN